MFEVKEKVEKGDDTRHKSQKLWLPCFQTSKIIYVQLRHLIKKCVHYHNVERSSYAESDSVNNSYQWQSP